MQDPDSGDHTVTYRHSFDAWPPASARHEPPGGDDAERPGWEVAADRLRSAVDRGVVFYWMLASGASDVAGGARSRLTVEASRRPGRSHSAEDEFDSVLPPRDVPPYLQHTPPQVTTSLAIDREDLSRDESRAIESALAAFTDAAQPFVEHEQWHRKLWYRFSEYRAIQTQTAHDLRALLQPLLLHVDQLRRRESETPNGLELLDDLTRAVVEWVEADLKRGGLAAELRVPSPSPVSRTGLQEALGEAMGTNGQRGLTAEGLDSMPELAVDRPLLVAGLRELLEFSDDGGKRLQMDRPDPSSLRLRIGLDSAPTAETPRGASSDEPDYPPVVGGLLNLIAWTSGALHIEVAPGEGGVGVELPLAPSTDKDAV